jgi:phospholipid/cholesterol/gamma-HCH transport system substrate-binding protein
MTLPMNKFPFIPPQVDPDPGAPVVQLPPGVAPGPGPAPNGPFPLPVPPNDNGPPLPWPYYAPPDQVVPPYGRQPPEAAPPPPAQAPPAPPADGGQPLPAEAPAAWGHHPPEGQGGGPAIATYDQNGKFVDPDGGTGVLAAGTAKLAPAENWVDLMLAPRQA